MRSSMFEIVHGHIFEADGLVQRANCNFQCWCIRMVTFTFTLLELDLLCLDVIIPGRFISPVIGEMQKQLRNPLPCCWLLISHEMCLLLNIAKTPNGRVHRTKWSPHCVLLTFETKLFQTSYLKGYCVKAWRSCLCCLWCHLINSSWSCWWRKRGRCWWSRWGRNPQLLTSVQSLCLLSMTSQVRLHCIIIT